MNEKQKKVLLDLQAQCIKRERCKKDVWDKALAALEGDADAAREVVDSLVEDKFVDEGRYCLAFARDKAHLSGWGPHKIMASLRAKRVDEDAIKAAILQTDDEESDNKLRGVLLNRFKIHKGEPYIKMRLIKFALQRGYDYDKVRVILEEILEDNKD